LGEEGHEGVQSCVDDEPLEASLQASFNCLSAEDRGELVAEVFEVAFESAAGGRVEVIG